MYEHGQLSHISMARRHSSLSEALYVSHGVSVNIGFRFTKACSDRLHIILTQLTCQSQLSRSEETKTNTVGVPGSSLGQD